MLVRAARLLDGALECAVVSFAWWTVLYHLALIAPVPASVVWWLWVAGTGVVVGARLRCPRGPEPTGGSGPNGVAMVVAAAMATLASVLVRPDLDDASYVVRSTWVAERGALRVGDVIFSDGRWAGLPEQTPYLPSFEGLLGMTARTLGVPAADVVYTWYVPVATFAAVWALWSLLRAWRVRAAAGALVLACLFLLYGGADHASWGNLHLGRIWQGKVTLLALVVPLVYAWVARYWDSRPGVGRATSLVLVGAAGVAAAGLSPAGIFVVPGAVAVAAAAGAFTGRVRRALVLLVVGSLYPLVGGVVMKIAGHTVDAIPGTTAISPWQRTLGTGVPMLVVVVAAVAALVSLLPGAARTRSRIGTLTPALAVLVGGLIALPPVTRALVSVMGTDAIVWRIVWVVPVPALVGMLAAPPLTRWRTLTPVVGLGAATALLLGGTPLWSAANRATITGPGSWKMAERDLSTARWIVADRSVGGRYLAREEVVAAVGAMTADLSPVGSRPGYIESYGHQPDAHASARLLLQSWVDGTDRPDGAAVQAALTLLDVRLVCADETIVEGLGQDWYVAWHGAADTCAIRRTGEVDGPDAGG